MISSRLKFYFVTMLVVSLIVALIGFFYTKKDLPPYPNQVVSEGGKTLTTKDEIMAGQQVWQKYGLMDLGSVWGHGTYRGPDFTAQSLNNMGRTMRATMAQARFGSNYEDLDEEQKGAVDAVIIK
jgi:nitric oxide reductase subunit B